jgi:uncharacterized LabA/DUF88 family protein
MQKRRVVAYVDGFNFYFRRLKNKPYRWLDLVALFDALFPNDDVVKVKYFTARVSGKFDPSKPVRQDVYLRALQTLSRLEIIEGQYYTKTVPRILFAPHTNDAGEMVKSALIWDSEEKGSDVNLGSHLINDAWEDLYDVAAVLTNDSDLSTPMQLALKRSKIVTLLHPDNNVSKMLIRSSSNSLHIHDKFLLGAQLPSSVVTVRGVSIHKPRDF